MGPKPEKIENGVFTLKRHGILSVHTTTEKFVNETIVGGGNR